MQKRRDFLKIAATVTAMGGSVEAQPPSETLLDARYQSVRGFNYVPSYAAIIQDAIDLFDAEAWDREFGYAKRFHSNALRIWCDYLSFQKDQNHFLRSWETALKLGEKHGLKLLITTANRWVDPRWPYGQLDLAIVLRGEAPQEFRDYLKTFIGTFKDHPQVLMWDLCNEPFSFPFGEGAPLLDFLKQQELNFWRTAVDAARAAQPSQPITFGVLGPERTPDQMHHLVDVISCHPYAGWWDDAAGFQKTCDYYVQTANQKRKPLICSETCQGSKNNETRTKIIQVSLYELEKRKIGWLAWQLMAGKIVTARWDRTDTNCRPGDQSVMYWVEKDGTTRPGHDERDWRTWSRVSRG